MREGAKRLIRIIRTTLSICVFANSFFAIAPPALPGSANEGIISASTTVVAPLLKSFELYALQSCKLICYKPNFFQIFVEESFFLEHPILSPQTS